MILLIGGIIIGVIICVLLFAWYLNEMFKR
jgi:hypothetical protein